MPPKLDYNSNVYLAVTLPSSSTFLSQPQTLADRHHLLTHVGQVGQLDDIHMYSVPKADWQQNQDEVLSLLRAQAGVGRVDVQIPAQRTRRDEL